MQRLFLSRNIETQRTRVGEHQAQVVVSHRCADQLSAELATTAADVMALRGKLSSAVSHSCAWIGSPCLRHCVHGVSIGGGDGGVERQASTRLVDRWRPSRWTRRRRRRRRRRCPCSYPPDIHRGHGGQSGPCTLTVTTVSTDAVTTDATTRNAGIGTAAADDAAGSRPPPGRGGAPRHHQTGGG
jgi:hypothetical protein